MASPKPKVTAKPKATPSPQATRKSDVVVATGRGSTIKMGDLGKTTPTPTAKTRVGVPKEYTSAEYDAQLKQVLKDIARRNR